MKNKITLATKGGDPIVDEKYRHFTHPVLSDSLVAWMGNKSNLESVTTFDARFITELEAKIKEILGLKYALVTNSGTSAIFEMFYTLDLKPGDEVIVPVYTFFSTATPLFVLGCKPVLADCLDNGNIDPKDIEKKITKKTKAIIITHMWGIPCDMKELMEISEKYNIPIVEDSSHAHGATYHGKIIGNFGKSSAWSLGTKKIISGGQGGVFGTNDQELYEKAILAGHANNKRLNNIRLAKFIPFSISGTGLNLRMHPYSAKVIFEQFENLNSQLKDRREVAKYLTKEISKIPGLTTPRVPENSEASWYTFPVFFNEKEFGISKEKFVEAVLVEGAEGVDIPGSTCPITEFQVFRQAVVDFEHGDTREDIYALDMFPGAKKFQENMFKLPMWYGEKAMEYAGVYMKAIKKVAENIDQLK